MKIADPIGLFSLCLLTGLLGSGVATAGPAGVVHLADQDTDDVFETYRVDLKTDAVSKINGPLVGGGEVVFFRILGG